MNERIKELAEQADIVFGFDKNNDPEVICSIMDIEKFAELIVRECAMLVETLSPGYNDYRDQIENAFRRDCVDNIKQHFGVE